MPHVNNYIANDALYKVKENMVGYCISLVHVFSG